MHLGTLYPPSHIRLCSDLPALTHPALVPPTPPCRRPNALHFRRRTLVSASASQDAQPISNVNDVLPDPQQKRAEIQANVERAAAMVGEIVDEVTREMFVSEAVAFLQEDQADQTEQSAVRMAVLRRVEFLDANFLTALTGFIRACNARGDAQLANLLTAVREEVLRQVSSRMPGAAQVLDLALHHVDRGERVAVLRTAADGGSGDIPGAELDTLAATAAKFIDEMEEQPEVLDRRLLARLVLVREELRNLREERRFNEPGQAAEPVRSNVPQRCAAFLKELVPVSDPLRRVGLLARALENDWDGAAPRQKPQTAFHAGQPDWVRPGRLLATLQSMVVQLQGEPEQNAAVLTRLEIIRSEALAVLDRMQSGGVAGAGYGGGSDGEAEEVVEDDGSSWMGQGEGLGSEGEGSDGMGANAGSDMGPGLNGSDGPVARMA